MNDERTRIDVHNHIIPAGYLRELNSIGLHESLGRSFPEWTAEQVMEVMGKNGIRVALTSVSAPGIYFGDISFTKKLARICNEASARLITDHPESFGAFATLPLPDVTSSLREMAYSADTLRLDGFVLLSNYGGTYIGDEAFEEIYAELDSRQAVVFVHPTDPPGGNPLGSEIPTFLMEVTFETTRVIFNLLYRGVLERYPRIRWIFAHAGGALPFLSWRISLGQFVLPHGTKAVPRGALHYLQNLYYDTGLSANPCAFASLNELVQADRILFGTDYPFAPEIITSETVRGLQSWKGFTGDDLNKIEYKNIINLFPRLQA